MISASADARSADPAVADDLPRHGIAGLIVAAPDSSKPEDSQTNPPTVKNVVTGGAGEAAGILPGDTLLELDGKPLATAASFAQQIGRHLAGDSVRVVLRRAGQKMEKTIVLKPRSFETSAGATILYRSITAPGAGDGEPSSPTLSLCRRIGRSYRNFKDIEEMLRSAKELIGNNGESKGIRIGPLMAPRFLDGRDSASVYFTHCPNRAVGFRIKFRGADGKPMQFRAFSELDPKPMVRLEYRSNGRGSGRRTQLLL